MGLFSKKEPCAICGGKVSGIFPSKIEGRLICKECYGTTDLPDNAENNMTLEAFKRYREFRAENQRLKSDFIVSSSVEFGLFSSKLVADFQHGLFCFDPNLNTTIFYGNQLKSVTVKEDSALLYNANAQEVVRYPSDVPNRIMDLAPRIDDYHRHRHMQEMNMRRNGPPHDNRPGQQRPDAPPPPPPPPINLPRVFDRFTVDMRFDHPYWGSKTITIKAPDFDLHNPDINDYMRLYNDKVQLIESFVLALAGVAFPYAPQYDAK